MSAITCEQERGWDTDVVAGEVDGEDDDQDDVVEHHDHLKHRIRAEQFAAVDGQSWIESHRELNTIPFSKEFSSIASV